MCGSRVCLVGWLIGWLAGGSVGWLVGWWIRLQLSTYLGGASTGILWAGMLICNPMGDFCAKHQKRLSWETPNPVFEQQIHLFLLWLLVSARHHYQPWTYRTAISLASWYTRVQISDNRKTPTIQAAELTAQATTDNVGGSAAGKPAGRT